MGMAPFHCQQDTGQAKNIVHRQVGGVPRKPGHPNPLATEIHHCQIYDLQYTHTHTSIT